EARVLNAADDGFALAATISRCEGKVGQTIALFSLPGEPCIYMERLAARADVSVHEVATGTATILNEDAPGIHRNRRTIWHAESAEDVQGAGGRAPLLLEWDTHWANVDGKLGVVSTSGAMAYRNASGYARSRLEEELIANHVMGIGAVGDGQEISAFVVAFLPNDAPDATKKRVLEWERDGDLIAARLGDIIVVANLGREKAEGDLFGNHVELDVLETMVSD
ncbi:MAG TPA: hypothetical protein QGH10_10515, partial [Armatimonadota bacterium]|nr:hypothetical protein [Armatimonadota bacterium]